MDILGIDPGLNRMGWGIVRRDGSRLSYVASGVIQPNARLPMAERLLALDVALGDVLARYSPAAAAVEETFVNANPKSSLILGQARGVALLVPARSGIPVAEYPATLIKKSVVGTGRAEKAQIAAMIRVLLPAWPGAAKADEADALAIAITHAHHAGHALALRAGGAAMTGMGGRS